MNKVITLSLICLSAFVYNNALASNNDLSLKIAQGYLDEGNASDGYKFLKIDFEENSKNPLEHRLLGFLAKATSRPREAKGHFHKVIELSTEPELAGEAKLEIALLEYSLGNITKAQEYAIEVRDSSPPARVGDTIESFLKDMTIQGSPKHYRLSAYVGYMHDTNANSGPDADSVLLYGLPFTLSNDAKENTDNLRKIGFNYNYLKSLTDTSWWESSLGINSTDYETINNLDSIVLSASSSYSTKIDDELTVSWPIVADWVRVGHENSYYSYTYGIAPQLQYKFDDDLSIRIGTSLSKSRYQSSSDRDSTNMGISPSLNYKFNKQSSMDFGASITKVNSGTESSSNKLFGINANYNYSFNNGIHATIYSSYSDSKYKAKEAAYTEKRRDKFTKYGLNLRYRVESIGSNLVLALSKSDNNSNLPMYVYDREQFSLTLRKYF